VGELRLRAAGGQRVEVLDASGRVVARADVNQSKLELTQPA
jgi:hypothetical protein